MVSLTEKGCLLLDTQRVVEHRQSRTTVRDDSQADATVLHRATAAAAVAAIVTATVMG